MKCASFYTLFFCLFYFKCTVNAVNSKLNDYLNKKAVDVQKTFVNEFKTSTVIGDFEIEETARSSHISGNYKCVFSLFNETFILLDNEVYNLQSNNGSITLKKVGELHLNSDIKFTKVTEFENVSLILVKTEMEIDVYKLSNNSIIFMHSLYAPNAADAHFFVNQNVLHLVVVNNKDDNLAISTMYKWLGTYFDETEYIITTGAIKVTSFTNNFFEVIIILQHDRNKRLSSTVYQYKFGKLKKIQHIITSEPVFLDLYPTKLGMYLLIFETSKNNLLHSWNGSKFQKISQFRTESIVNKSISVTSNGTSIFAIPNKEKIQAFRLLSKELKPLGEGNSNFSKILDIHKNGDTNIVYIVGLDQDDALYISSISIEAQVTDSEHQVSKDGLKNCFHTLNMKLFGEKMNLIKRNEILGQVKDEAISEPEDSTDSNSQTTLNSSEEENDELQTNMDDLKAKLKQLHKLLSNVQNNDEINTNVRIKGSVEAEQLTAKSIFFKKINNNFWLPKYWLNYKQPQNITGPVTVDKIVVAEFNTSSTHPLFTEILTKHGDQDVWGRFEVANLTTNKIITETINDLPVKNIHLRSDPEPIQGLKTFENLNTASAKIKLLNGKSPNNLLSIVSNVSEPIDLVFNNNLEIENLEANIINDIQWNSFRDSVFRMGVTKEINGNLHFPEFKANNITLQTLKDTRVDELLTSSTDQIIEADMEFVEIMADNITTNTTNDIELSKTAVQLENNTLVEAPVKFDQLFVRKDLELIGKLEKEFFYMDGEHIIGTSEQDLWQNYNGIVKIKGNLYVKNITFEPNAKLFLAEEEFDQDIGNTYWTKNTMQSIPVPFEVQNGLSVPHLFINELNGINFTQYMLNNDEDRLKTSYHFENVSIVGDVFLNSKANHTPNLTKLNEEAVRTTGSYVIKGKKIYTDMLHAENLETTTLGDVAIDDILPGTSSVNVTGKKVFKNITVKENLSCNIKSVEFINGVNMTHLLENAIYIDQPRNIEKLHFKNITVKDLWVTKLNNRQVNQHILNVQQILASTKFDKLVVNGNVVLRKVIGVSKINNIKFEDLLKKPWKRGKFGGILTNLKFLAPVKIGNLLATNINNLDLEKLVTRFLYRNFHQNITATYSFKNIKTENLVVSKINNVTTKDLIDVSHTVIQTMYVPGGIEFSSAIVQDLRTHGTSPCDTVIALQRVIDPPTLNWNNVRVKGNATFLDPDNALYRLFERTVTSNSKNVIQVPVQFASNVVAENVITEKHINDVDLQEIFDDAILADPDDDQVITGRKEFSIMKISKGYVAKNADIPVINNVDIMKTNKAVIKKDDVHNFVINGRKTFYGGLQCEKFYSEKVSNIDVDNIVTTANLRKIPEAIFDSLEVEDNMDISKINNFNFDTFLETRLVTHGISEQTINGVYFFDNIQVEHTRTGTINNISMDDVVFDIGQQNISSSKRFTQLVEVFGNLSCPFINGVNLSELYENSKNDMINGSLTLLRPSVVEGSIKTEYINDYPIEKIKEILDQGTVKSETDKIRLIQTEIADRIKRNVGHIECLASDYMYIEKSQALQIAVPDVTSAKTMVSNGYVLIHVDGEQSGKYCGLPEKCKCPVQYSIEISPEHSVSIFPNKGFQRIFTFDNDDMLINFLTNSLSTDSECRSKSARAVYEVSFMTWSTKKNTTGFYQHNQYVTGYISGAEFFTHNGQTYAIIGRYYDPILDSHDLDCYLIKFSHDKSTAETIQKIPTKGAWSVYLFYTAQGVTLIIGNIKTTNTLHVEEETQIYRFDTASEEFKILRIVPFYGCSMATGVVLGTDSLIVLAHRYAPLQVLKYNPAYDNYYFYQSFELEAPVIGVSVFYTGGFGISDAYLCTVTANENYFIYSFRFVEGWRLESSGEMEGLRNLIPFELNHQSYLFAPSSKSSSLLTVIKHDSV